MDHHWVGPVVVTLACCFAVGFFWAAMRAIEETMAMRKIGRRAPICPKCGEKHTSGILSVNTEGEVICNRCGHAFGGVLEESVGQLAQPTPLTAERFADILTASLELAAAGWKGRGFEELKSQKKEG